MSKLRKSLEQTFNEFYRAVFEHAFELAKEFPEESDPKKIFDPCNADDQIKAIDSALTAFQDILPPYKDYMDVSTEEAYHTNQTIAEIKADIKEARIV